MFWTDTLQKVTQNEPLIWFPMTNYTMIDQSNMSVSWQSVDHIGAWEVKGERHTKACFNNGNEQDWWVQGLLLHAQL